MGTLNDTHSFIDWLYHLMNGRDLILFAKIRFYRFKSLFLRFGKINIGQCIKRLNTVMTLQSRMTFRLENTKLDLKYNNYTKLFISNQDIFVRRVVSRHWCWDDIFLICAECIAAVLMFSYNKYTAGENIDIIFHQPKISTLPSDWPINVGIQQRSVYVDDKLMFLCCLLMCYMPILI